MDKKIKKKTLELFTKCFMAFLFLSSWVVLGVALALRQADVNVGGNVNFKATSVYAKLSGEIKDCNGTKTLEEITINSKTVNSEVALESWKIDEIKFGDKETIDIFIQIENLAEDRGLHVMFADNISEGGDFSVDSYLIYGTINDDNETSNTEIGELTNITINSNSTNEATKTLKLQLKVNNRNVSFIKSPFDLDITLSKDEIKDSTDYSEFNFNLISGETNKVSITRATDDISGDLKIPAQVKYNNVICDVTKIENSAFYQRKSITSVVIPSTVTEIGDYAFKECSNLETVSGLNGVEKFGIDAFRSCTSLTKIVIPSSVKTWGTMVFRGCTALNSVLIQAGVEEIGTSAFRGCSELTSIVIPESVKKIGVKAFYLNGRGGLTSAIFKNQSGWSAGDKEFADGELADASVNATYLKSTYQDKEWSVKA